MQAGRFVYLSPPQMGDVELSVCPDSIETDAARYVAGSHGENGWSTSVISVFRERSSTIGEGEDTTIWSPGRSPKQSLPGIGLHDPLYGRQACPEFNAFDQGVGQLCPR